MAGEGLFYADANLGGGAFPILLNCYIHIEARSALAAVYIADNVRINNNAVIIVDKNQIYTGRNTLIGTEFTVYDSDFHDLNPSRRMGGVVKSASVYIDENVFIGSRVSVMKGVTIGANSVIANGSIVTRDVPSNCIAAGVPAKLIKRI